MEYICKITRNPELKFWITGGINSVRLPLFDRFLKRIQKTESGDYVLFYKEDRYTPSLITVYPPKEITEKQMEIINDKWNYCIENNINSLEFDI